MNASLSLSLSLTIKLAWGITLLVSILPDIFWREFVSEDVDWLFWVKMGTLAALVVLTIFWMPLRSLRAFIGLWLVMYATMQVSTRLNFSLPFVQDALGGGSFVHEMQPEQFGKLAVALVVIIALLAFGYKLRQLYLTPGRLDAPIAPVRWLGFPKPDPWWQFGLQYGFYIPLAMGVVAYLVGHPEPGWQA